MKDISIAPHQNNAEISGHTNSLEVRAVDIYTHWFFLQPAQVLEQHEEV